MIEHTLIKLAVAVKKERELTRKIGAYNHLCSFPSEFGPQIYGESQLSKYFNFCKEEGYENSFDEYCEFGDERMCPQCALMLETITERRKIRRKIGSLRGAITKYALSLIGYKEAEG